MAQNKSALSCSYTAFDPQSMVNFGCIGARFMVDFRFEKLALTIIPLGPHWDSLGTPRVSYIWEPYGGLTS